MCHLFGEMMRNEDFYFQRIDSERMSTQYARHVYISSVVIRRISAKKSNMFE